MEQFSKQENPMLKDWILIVSNKRGRLVDINVNNFDSDAEAQEFANVLVKALNDSLEMNLKIGTRFKTSFDDLEIIRIDRENECPYRIAKSKKSKVSMAYSLEEIKEKLDNDIWQML